MPNRRRKLTAEEKKMWHEIKNDREAADFMDKVYAFHDSCIKEMQYISGAYVNEELAMIPVNRLRVLRVLLQRQFDDLPVIELEFEGLRFLKLFPNDERYTCEILDSALFLKDGCIYWCDCGDVSEDDLEHYRGTLICAEKLRWREVEHGLGEKEIYGSNP